MGCGTLTCLGFRTLWVGGAWLSGVWLALQRGGSRGQREAAWLLSWKSQPLLPEFGWLEAKRRGAAPWGWGAGQSSGSPSEKEAPRKVQCHVGDGDGGSGRYC